MALIGIKVFDAGVEVTGLVASGTTDGLGIWNSINIETILSTAGHSLPPEATAVCIRMTNLSTSAARWGGVRTNAKITPVMHRDQLAGNEDNFLIVPLNAANKLVDFYTESIGASDRTRFLISHALIGYVPLDIDGTLPTQATTSGVLTTRTISELPASVTFLARYTTSGKWCPTAQSSVSANGMSGFQYMLLDSSKQIKLSSTTTLTIYGYWPVDSVTWEPWLTGVITPVADSTWRASPFIKTGKKGVFGFSDESVTTTRHDVRMKGSTRAIAPTSGMSGSYNSFFVNVDSNGESEYWFETGGAGNFYYMASFDEFTSSASSVITPTTITPGETFTVIPSGFAGAITLLTATDAQGNTLTLPVTSNQATIPALAAGVANLLMGDITIEVTDGVTTASDVSSYIADTGYNYINVGTPLIDGHSVASGLADDSIIVAALDQFNVPTAYATSMASNTTIESNLLDDYVTLYMTVGTDHNGLTGGMVYQVDYYFDEYGGGSVVERGLTASVPTMQVIEMETLTMVGL